jgi:hypothetical protein
MGKQFSLIFDMETSDGKGTTTDAIILVRPPPFGSHAVCTLVAARNGVEWVDFVLHAHERDDLVAALLSYTTTGDSPSTPAKEH